MMQEATGSTKPHISKAAIETCQDEDEFSKTLVSKQSKGGDGNIRSHEHNERSRQREVFQDWLAEYTLREEEKATELVDQGSADSTVAALVACQKTTAVIQHPREYQLELYERAKLQNTIAVLDTGKTMIAILLLRYILDQELEDRRAGKRPRIAFFLVNSALLVFHQYAVLESNLDQPIGHFCGDMGCDLWSGEIWQSAFAKSKVIVCTADILDQCLMHSFISMNDINLIVFDEAHHAKKGHVYARIMKEHYEYAKPACRPRIFAMTASPVDAKEDAVFAAKSLEMTLHARIATASDLSFLKFRQCRPREHVVPYDAFSHQYDTSLTISLRQKLARIPCIDRLFSFARHAVNELGEWSVTRYWQLVMAEEDIAKITRKIEEHYAEASQGLGGQNFALANDLEQIRRAQADVLKWPEGKADHEFNVISPKVQALISILGKFFEEENDNKCIIFVSRRYTAILLHELLQKSKLSHLKSEALLGSGAAEIRTTIRQQILRLGRFRNGELNCLIATSVAEEGFDIPDCNVAIRFDLCTTTIKYIQSRGRLRHREADFFHIVQRDSASDRHLIHNVRHGEEQMKRFCKMLPADRILSQDMDEDNPCDATKLELDGSRYVEPSTGATLTPSLSQVVLAQFAACLARRGAEVEQPMYNVMPQSSGFICEVTLPHSSPLHSATGHLCPQKLAAKRSAAFRACCQLREMGHLDANLLPTYQKLLPKMRNAHLAVSEKESSSYSMKLKPSLWSIGQNTIPQIVYATLLNMRQSEDGASGARSLVLLTRYALTQLPDIGLHLHSDTITLVKCVHVRDPIYVTADQVTKLTEFTLCIFRDVFNKQYACDAQVMPYWIAPALDHQLQKMSSLSLTSIIDWKAIELCTASHEISHSIDDPKHSLVNRYLLDPLHGGIRYISTGVDPNKAPSDKVPDEVRKTRFHNSILQYTLQMSSALVERGAWMPDQPVLKAIRLTNRLNWLQDASFDSREPSSIAWICPQPLRISTLSPENVFMSYLFPSIITQIESVLIATEACQLLDLAITPALAMEAFSKSPHIDTEKTSRSYERLEFLGDCFLKMATSISLFAMMPADDEFEFHVKRMLMICNRNLLKTGKERSLPEFVRTVVFSRRTWYPQGLTLLKGKGVDKIRDSPATHRLSDKTIADVVEAIIGAALLSCQPGDFDEAVKAVTILCSSPNHSAVRWSDYLDAYHMHMPAYQLASATASQIDLAEQIELKFGYRFHYPRLLRSAFLHPSYPFVNEKIPCYQRLEFLGDSLLDMACVNFLFHRWLDKDPQWLTEHKMAVVSNQFLAALSVKLGFHKHIRFNGSAVQSQIQEYATAIEDARSRAHDKPDYWRQVHHPPKALSDVVESYIGAIFVDSGFDYKVVERFFQTHIQPFFEHMSMYDNFANNHPVTLLHTVLSTQFRCQQYRVMAGEKPDVVPTVRSSIIVAAVIVHDVVIADGRAESIKSAKVTASQRALDRITGMHEGQFRETFHCDCHVSGQDEHAGAQ